MRASGSSWPIVEVRAEMKMTVDIIIPTMNRPKSLERALKSLIVNSGFPVTKIIIVDSSNLGKHREVLKVAQEIESLFEVPVDVFHQPPRGPSAAMNVGIQHSKSKFIVRVDDDVVCDRNWLERIIKIFRSDRKIGCCFVRVLPMRNDLRSRIYTAALSMDKGKKTYIFSAKDLSMLSIIRSIKSFIKWKIMGGSSKGFILPPFIGYIVQAFRRSAIFSVGLYDEDLSVGRPSGGGEEPDLAYRMLRRGWKVAYVGDSVVYHDCSREFKVIIRDAFEAGTSKRALIRKYVRRGDVYMVILSVVILASLVLEYNLARSRTLLEKAFKKLKAVELYGYLKGSSVLL